MRHSSFHTQNLPIGFVLAIMATTWYFAPIKVAVLTSNPDCYPFLNRLGRLSRKLSFLIDQVRPVGNTVPTNLFIY